MQIHVFIYKPFPGNYEAPRDIKTLQAFPQAVIYIFSVFVYVDSVLGMFSWIRFFYFILLYLAFSFFNVQVTSGLWVGERIFCEDYCDTSNGSSSRLWHFGRWRYQSVQNLSFTVNAVNVDTSSETTVNCFLLKEKLEFSLFVRQEYYSREPSKTRRAVCSSVLPANQSYLVVMRRREACFLCARTHSLLSACGSVTAAFRLFRWDGNSNAPISQSENLNREKLRLELNLWDRLHVSLRPLLTSTVVNCWWWKL